MLRGRLALVVMVVCSAVQGGCERLVSIADLHGDFDHAVAILRVAELAEETEQDGTGSFPEGSPPFRRFRGVRWIGGNATLVQTGDIVDRGPEARDVYALFQELRRQAPESGGKVINLIGNHEVMNLMGQLHYVPPEDTELFGGSTARREAFSSNGWVGRQILEDFRAVALEQGTIFVHAGVLPSHLKKHGSIEELDLAVRSQLRKGMASYEEGSLLQSKGPLWVRNFAMDKEEKMCPVLEETLRLAGASRMVIGHTQVEDGQIRPRCQNRLLMADTIISKTGYPMCWHEFAWEQSHCRAGLSFVEVLNGVASAVQVSADGSRNLNIRPLPLETNSRPEL